MAHRLTSWGGRVFIKYQQLAISNFEPPAFGAKGQGERVKA